MGIFGFKNKHDIIPKDKDLTFVVNRFAKVTEIKLNAKLVVPNGYCVVIGKRGKTCDKFEAGEYYLNYHNLPLMCRKFGLDKHTSKNKSYKMPVDFYFLGKGIYGGKLKSLDVFK